MQLELLEPNRTKDNSNQKQRNNQNKKQSNIIQNINNINMKLMEYYLHKFKINIQLLYLFYLLRNNSGINNLYENLEKEIIKDKTYLNNEDSFLQMCNKNKKNLNSQKKKQYPIGLNKIPNKIIKEEIIELLNDNSIFIDDLVEYYTDKLELIQFINLFIKYMKDIKNIKNNNYKTRIEIINNLVKYPPSEINEYFINNNEQYKNSKTNQNLSKQLFQETFYFFNNPWRIEDKNKMPLRKNIKVNEENCSYEILDSNNQSPNSKEYELKYEEDDWYWIDKEEEKLQIEYNDENYIYKYDPINGWGWFCGNNSLSTVNKIGSIELEPKGYKDLYHPPEPKEIPINEKKLLLFSTIIESKDNEIQSINEFINKYRNIINILCSQNCNDKNYNEITRNIIEYIKNRKGSNFCSI